VSANASEGPVTGTFENMDLGIFLLKP
jgi:hypothetical protein